MPSDLYRVIYTVQRKKSFQQNRLDPQHTGSAQFTMSQICAQFTMSQISVTPEGLGQIQPSDLHKVQH